MNKHDRFVVANTAQIDCTARTLRPFYLSGESRPWVHSGEISDALLYLAARAGMPSPEISALREQLENLSSLLTALSDSKVPHPAAGENTNEPRTQNTLADEIPF